MTGGRSRILIVDDDRTNINVLGSLLADTHDVSVALDGEQALKIVESGLDVDLVLLDLRMPGISGIEVASRIRAGVGDTEASTVPVIAMTASVLEGEDEACREVGMNELLLKPVAPDDLFEAIDHWLSAGQSGAGRGFRVSGSARRQSSSERADGPIDFQHLVDMVGADPAMVRQTLDQFIASVEEDVAALENMAASGDVSSEDIRYRAHRIKGAANLAGSFDLGDKAFALEKQAAEGQSTIADPLVSEVIELVRSVGADIGNIDLDVALDGIEEDW